MKFFVLIVIILSIHIHSQPIEIRGNIESGNILFCKVLNAVEVYFDEEPVSFDIMGNFIIAFDRNDTIPKTLTVNYFNGTSEKKTLTPKKRKWKIQHIKSTGQGFVPPKKDEEERIKIEREIVREARSKIGEIDSALYYTGFMRPVEGGRYTGVFGSQRIINGNPQNIHNGLDIAAPIGTPVYAMADGFVRLAREDFYYNGTFVLLEHGYGLNSTYLHLNKLNVEEGTYVKKGDQIGEIGTTGRSTGPHLHWGVQWFGKRIDPANLLKIK